MSDGDTKVIRNSKGRFERTDGAPSSKRPAPNGNAQFVGVDPLKAGAAPGAAAGEPDATPKSGRRESAPGAGAARPAGGKTGASLDLGAWAGIIGGAHAVVAMTRNESHWLLTDADAKQYGAALHNAMRHFPVQVTQKALDVGALMMMVFMMETPRVRNSWQKGRERQRPTSSPAPGGGAQVYRLHPDNPAPSPAPSPAPTPPAVQPPNGLAAFTHDRIAR